MNSLDMMDELEAGPPALAQTPREQFGALFEARTATQDSRQSFLEQTQAKLEEATAEAVRALGKKPKTYESNRKIVGPEKVKEIFDQHDAMLAEGVKGIDAQVKALDEQLRALAPSCEVKKAETLILFESTYAGAWVSSGTEYPRGHVTMRADMLKQAGYVAEVRKGPGSYDLWVGVEEQLDLEILKRQPVGWTLREWVKQCWSRGLNPRVYQPFLPWGYEESVGMDQFGRERPNTSIVVGTLYKDTLAGDVYAHPTPVPAWQDNFTPSVSFHKPGGSKGYVRLDQIAWSRLVQLRPEGSTLRPGEYLVFDPPVTIAP